MIPFDHLGCTEQVRGDFEDACRVLGFDGGELSLGRVTSLDRGFPLVNTADSQVRAELAASIKKSADSIVAVGDWVVLRAPDGHEKGIIAQVLPRQTEIARVKRVGREKQVRRQVLAANVDTVLVCQSLTGQGLDVHLLLRQLVAVFGCGARPVLVFTKADAVGPDVAEGALEQVAGMAPDVRSLAIAVSDARAVASVAACCEPGRTSLLLGESGVGKSSLVNALVGDETFDVGEVRASDDKGRHTTVARRMVELPGGGLLIDAPGLRTLQVIDAPASLAAAFPDVSDAALGCRFRDCTHVDEPGCAVREEVDPRRLEAYRLAAQLVERGRR